MNDEVNGEADISLMTDQAFTPTLHDIDKILRVNIVGEEEARMALFISWVLARKYVVLSGPSRSGKTHLKENVKTLIEKDTFEMTSGSDKSPWYAAEQIQKHRYVDVPELNQVPKDFVEILKMWGENKKATYSVVTTDPASGKRKNDIMNLPYRPFVFCIADENTYDIPKELRYRLMEIRCDSSEEQNRKIIAYQAAHAKNPRLIRNLDRDLLKDLQAHITTLPPFSKYYYVNPMADIVAESVPKQFTDCRTAHLIFQDIISGIQRYYWKQSLIIQDKKYRKPLMFVSPQTVMQAYIILGKIFINSSLKCNDFQRTILSIIRKAKRAVDKKYITKELKRTGIITSNSMVTKHLNELTELTYLDCTDTQTAYYDISEGFQKQKLNINGKDLIQESLEEIRTHFPEALEAYEQAYLGPGRLTFIHPFTGEQHTLTEYESNWDREDDALENAENINTYINQRQKEILEEEQHAQKKQEAETMRITTEDITNPDTNDITNPTDEDLINFIKERLPEGYPVQDFVMRYGEETLNRLKLTGQAFMPTPLRILPL